MNKPFETVAIVGQSCILPQANSAQELLQNTLEQRSSLSSAQDGRFGTSLGNFYPLKSDSDDQCLHDIAAYVKDNVSAENYLRSQSEKDLYANLDPLFSWTTKCSAEALKEAHFEAHKLPKGTGLILGNLSYPTESMARLGTELLFNVKINKAHLFDRYMSGLPAQIAAQSLGLDGHSFSLDAACASSLYAIAYACDMLHSRKASLMLAGAVNRADPLFLHAGFSELQALSPSGQSQPFSANADGLIPGEGAGVIALMRLDDAIAQSRPIHAVIRGVGLSNDGRAKSLLSPSSEGQKRAMQLAYQKAQISPQSIQWIDCHATGTTIGDATELESMQSIFNTGGGHDKRIAIGSLKANIGHLITAAGISGTIRTIEALKQKIIPPQKTVDTEIQSLKNSIFYLPKKAEKWHRPSGHPRRAAVSAFGFGGNNAHLILEDFEKRGHTSSSIHQVQSQIKKPTKSLPKIVIVGLAAHIENTDNLQEIFDSQLKNLQPQHSHKISFEAQNLKFPPNDIKQSLAQQIAILNNARSLEKQIPEALFSGERSGCFIGMGCDLDVTSIGVRWRLEETLKKRNISLSLEELKQLKDAISPSLNAQSVLGKMPNIPANRLNVQFDMRGPGHTVSSEEFSGLSAMQLAINALQKKELDFTLVGASDFNDDLRQRLLNHKLHQEKVPSHDNSILFAMMRKEDAEKINVPIWCQVEALNLEQSSLPNLSADSLSHNLLNSHKSYKKQSLPHSHAASALTTLFEEIINYHRSDTMSHGKELRLNGMASQNAQIKLIWPTHKLELPKKQTMQFKCEAVTHPSLERFYSLLENKVISDENEITTLKKAEALNNQSTHNHNQKVNFSMPTAPQITISHALSENDLAVKVKELASYQSLMTTAPDLNNSVPKNSNALSIPQSELASSITLPLLDSNIDSPLNRSKQHSLTPKTQNTYENLVLNQISQLKSNLLQSHAQFLDLQQQGQSNFLQQIQSRQQQIFNSIQNKTHGMATSRINAMQELQSITFQNQIQNKPVSIPIQQQQELKLQTGLEDISTVTSTKEVMFTREQLEVLASETISSVFGPIFKRQDKFRRQVRMPEPPLLLCDRVLSTDAKPGQLEKNRNMITESDVTWDKWYIQNGRIPAGILIESGQADLLLISYMGVDFENKGERVYRLLGCDLSYFGGLPEVGALLYYDIYIDGFANMGETSMFFFHSDCRIGGPNGEIVLSVRNGQAGFFTDEELANSNGVLWSPEDIPCSELQKIEENASKQWASLASLKSTFSESDLRSLNSGDAFTCFGAGFEMTQCHVRTPKLYHPSHNSDFNLHFVDRVTDFSPTSGPWKRGYLRAELDLTAESWFYKGHFKDDPCMPGTLMFEGCLQVMSFYLLALGLGIDKDAYRFEPMMDHVFPLRCRGQAIPNSKKLVYEIFIRDIKTGDAPEIYADLLITVDGLKALHCENAALTMQFDYPLSSQPQMLGYENMSQNLATFDAVGGIGHPEDKKAVYNQRALLATGWGKPSDAFEGLYEKYDHGSKIPRLPGPPYHFMSRVSSLTGPQIGAFQAGNEVVVDYDVPTDAWYFQEHSWQTMPFAILLEIALQPCGWLSSYTGSALQSEDPLYYRNLDGNGVFHRMIMPDSGTLQTKAKMTNVSSSAGMIIQSFELEVTDKDGPIFTGDTVFGFFPKKALMNQLGIKKSSEEETYIAQVNPDSRIELKSQKNQFTGFKAHQIAPDKMLMIDCIEDYAPKGGKHSLGKILAKKKICPSQWFFKAHFFQDPVQPGSLGVEAILQTLMWWAQKEGKVQPGQKISPLVLGEKISWKYRGQVVPTNKEVSIEVDIISSDENGMLAEAYLWVDGLRIYHTKRIGLSFLA